MKKRVVITGIGAVSPIGNTAWQMWENALKGTCGIAPITYFDTEAYRVKLAGEIKNLDTEMYLNKRETKFNDRFTQYARIAALQARCDAGLDEVECDQDSMGVILGSGIGGISTIEGANEVLNEKGPTRVSPFFIPMSLVNLAAGSVAMDVKAQGCCESVVTACAAATNAIGEAFHRIQDGRETIIYTGGSEAAITPLAIAGFMSMRALHEGDDPSCASIPFDANRKGFVMGEGAGILVLEELEHAKNRGARILAEVVGYGTTCDANHITAPLADGSQAARAMKIAMLDANIQAEEIQYINAHGTSTPLNDSSETLAIKAAFKEAAMKVRVSSTKSMTGHLLGASGAVEAIFAALCCKEDVIVPTIHYRQADPNCDLNLVVNETLATKVKYAMSNSLGFGGHNASLIFKKWED